MSRKTGAPSSTSPWKGRTIAYGWQLAPVTSPLVGEVGSRALRASREGGNRSAESNKHPSPHPSPTRGPTRGEGAECGLLRAALSGGGKEYASRQEHNE